MIGGERVASLLHGRQRYFARDEADLRRELDVGFGGSGATGTWPTARSSSLRRSRTTRGRPDLRLRLAPGEAGHEPDIGGGRRLVHNVRRG